MFQDDEEFISGRLLCAFAGEEGYRLVMGFKAKCKRSNADSWVEDRGLDPTRCVMLWPWVDRDGGKWQRLCF